MGVDLTAESGDFPAIVKKVEAAILAKGGAGRFGCWPYSYSFAAVSGLGDFAKSILDGKAKVDSRADLLSALAGQTPGAKWNGTYYTDQATGRRSNNFLMVYMDTYMFGKGFLPTTSMTIPEKYFQIKFKPE